MPLDREAFDAMEEGEDDTLDKIVSFLCENPGDAYRVDEIIVNTRLPENAVRFELYKITAGEETYDFDNWLLSGLLHIRAEDMAEDIDVPIEWKTDPQGRIWYACEEGGKGE